jgi:hypothetical protein
MKTETRVIESAGNDQSRRIQVPKRFCWGGDVVNMLWNVHVAPSGGKNFLSNDTGFLLRTISGILDQCLAGHVVKVDMPGVTSQSKWSA